MNNQTNILDVAIIGGGISGIGNGYWLQKKCPNRTFEIFESREEIGGTWSLFNYPGIRSDSDMFTFGYRFKPWMDNNAIAEGDKILNYLKEVVAENNLEKKINFNHKIIEANWSSEENLWTLKMKVNDEVIERKARCVSCCAGYYNYDEAFKPQFKGEKDFKGDIVIPQFWPKDLNYKDKKVVVIGSGATAITILPNMAERGAKHVTMLQRSPSYIVSIPNNGKIYASLKKYMSDNIAYKIVRYFKILIAITSFYVSKTYPNFMKKLLIKQSANQLPKGYDIKKHFTPKYNPWDQRLCVVPDGDFYKAISSGKASVETDTISHFTEKGIIISSGKEIEADIIVMATGLNIKMIGGIVTYVDGKKIISNQHLGYKGMMVSNIPNFITSFGYTNNSWTLRVDLIANYFCRLLNFLDKKNYTYFMPIQDDSIERHSVTEELNSGYITRSEDQFVKQGNKNPWKAYQNYIIDMIYTRFSKINDSAMKFK